MTRHRRDRTPRHAVRSQTGVRLSANTAIAAISAKKIIPAALLRYVSRLQRRRMMRIVTANPAAGPQAAMTNPTRKARFRWAYGLRWTGGCAADFGSDSSLCLRCHSSTLGWSSLLRSRYSVTFSGNWRPYYSAIWRSSVSLRILNRTSPWQPHVAPETGSLSLEFGCDPRRRSVMLRTSSAGPTRRSPPRYARAA